MSNLYITEQGSVLRKTGDRLVVQKDNEILLDVQCSKIDAVLIFGNVQFTTQAVHELFEHEIEMALLTRTGKLIGQITSPFTKNIELRIEQFKKYNDKTFRLNLSKAIVNGKITNCLNLMAAFSCNHSEINLEREMTGLGTSIKTINCTDSVAALRGVEGIATRTYFEGVRKMLLGEFTFTVRKKRPSTDPVNALLSFGYTLIFNEISSLLDGLGFDPYLGYFHEVEYGRASLACDLQEEFRPIIDRFTLYLINNRMVNENDFYKNLKDGSVYLKKEAMKKYFIEYEKNLNHGFKHTETGENTTIRKCFRIQAEKLANHIKNGNKYTPFKIEP
jgi:CRISPR-associated protein Cas1